jgi:hypothetical protein
MGSEDWKWIVPHQDQDFVLEVLNWVLLPVRREKNILYLQKRYCCGVTSCSLSRRPGFNHKALYVRFVVNNVALGQYFL